MNRRILGIIGILIFGIPAAFAASLPPHNGDYTSARGSPWIFAAPPRGSVHQQRAFYQPLIHYLARVTGHRIHYWGARSWFVYGSMMAHSKYAIVFDGPQFTAWRDEHQHYRPLVRLHGSFRFQVITRASSSLVRLTQLAGEPVCANSPPNLAALILWRHMSAWDRPNFVTQHGVAADYQGLLSGACDATIVPTHFLTRMNPKYQGIRMLYTSHAYLNQAISVGPQVPRAMQTRLQAALLTPVGQRLAQRLFHGRFVTTNRAAYSGYRAILDHSALFGDLVGKTVLVHDARTSSP